MRDLRLASLVLFLHWCVTWSCYCSILVQGMNYLGAILLALRLKSGLQVVISDLLLVLVFLVGV